MSTPSWLMDFTSNAAETFVTAYYAASDSPQRGQLLPSLYLPNSSVAWNGHPISGSSLLAQWLEAQPGSQHEIQAFDCHPLGPYDAHGTYQSPAHAGVASARGRDACAPGDSSGTPLPFQGLAARQAGAAE